MARKQKFPHLLGSKWTALQKTEGWRHFEVVNRKNQGSWVFAELVASCVRRYAFGLMPNSSKIALSGRRVGNLCGNSPLRKTAKPQEF